MDLFIGIDAGGTRSRLCARPAEGGPDFHCVGGAAHARRNTLSECASTLGALVQEALDRFSLANVTALHAGIAGAGEPQIQAHLTALLESHLAGMGHECDVTVSHDGIIALEGTFAGGSGLLLIAGTGSGVLARTQSGSSMQTGGWGYLIGDEGSGFTIGRLGLRAVAHALDGGPDTQIAGLVAEHLGLRDRATLLDAVFDSSFAIQHTAPLVLEAAAAGDPTARHIVRDSTAQLAEQVRWTLRKAPDITPRYAITGGLGESPVYVTFVREHLERVWPEATLVPAQHSPLEGAVRMAARYAGYRF